MTAAHTPGPWTLETVQTSCGICHKVGPFPHQWRGGQFSHACFYDDYPPPGGQNELLANAILTVAAPDMLLALQLHVAYQALSTDRGGKSWPKGKARQAWIDARNDAIAKATGATK